MKFEWDDAKDQSNQIKHGVSFAEAQRLFESSDDYLGIFDAEHSDAEERFTAIGPIDRGIVVFVYTEPEGARFANKREEALFRSHMDMYR